MEKNNQARFLGRTFGAQSLRGLATALVLASAAMAIPAHATVFLQDGVSAAKENCEVKKGKKKSKTPAELVSLDSAARPKKPKKGMVVHATAKRRVRKSTTKA